MSRFPGYTLRTLLDEDAELVTLLNLEADEKAAAALTAALEQQQPPW